MLSKTFYRLSITVHDFEYLVISCKQNQTRPLSKAVGLAFHLKTRIGISVGNPWILIAFYNSQEATVLDMETLTLY